MHDLNTLAFLHDNQTSAAHLRAADPGNNAARAAEDRLMEAIKNVADALESIAAEDEAVKDQTESIQRARQPEWSVAIYGDEAWVLPITSKARGAAVVLIPPGTRRYGMHYILDLTNPVSVAVLESIREV